VPEYDYSIVRLHLYSMAGRVAGVLGVIYIGAALPGSDGQRVLARAEDVAQIILTQNTAGTCEAHLTIDDDAATWGNSHGHRLLYRVGPEAIVTMWHDLIKSWAARQEIEPPKLDDEQRKIAQIRAMDWPNMSDYQIGQKLYVGESRAKQLRLKGKMKRKERTKILS